MNFFKCVKNGKIVSVESNSHGKNSTDFVKATQKEYDNFITALPKPEPRETLDEKIRKVVLNMKSEGEI